MNQFAFFGTPRFAEIFLEESVSKGFVPSLVITNPDRPAGRKHVLTPPPVKVFAEQNGIPVFQPEKLSPEALKDAVSGCEFAVVAAYGGIIPRGVIDLFPKGILCIHPSLLPELRGATPIQTALLEGKKETGTTIFLIDERVDHGAILSQKKISVTEEDDYISLEEKLAKLGAELFAETTKDYVAEKIKALPQDESKATLTKKFSREDAYIPEAEVVSALQGKEPEKVLRKIRAFSAEPGAWTKHTEKEIKLLSGKIEDGKLVITELQREGKNPQRLSSKESPF